MLLQRFQSQIHFLRHHLQLKGILLRFIICDLLLRLMVLILRQRWLQQQHVFFIFSLLFCAIFSKFSREQTFYLFGTSFRKQPILYIFINILPIHFCGYRYHLLLEFWLRLYRFPNFQLSVYVLILDQLHVLVFCFY